MLTVFYFIVLNVFRFRIPHRTSNIERNPSQRNLPKKLGGWTGSLLLPFVLLSEKSDSNFLVVGISPFGNLSGGEPLTDEQAVRTRFLCSSVALCSPTPLLVFAFIQVKDISHVKFCSIPLFVS
jgi:hypothetical protein